ncbi:hypothetical protein HZC08_02160, partial [Candidatus Micrarchaeota archaeon]|nr:hypothetical protein [Candidatus Micrarchaeota archaeon]
MELSTNQLEFLEKCEEARKLAFSFKNPLILHHYDSVTGDNEILYSLNGKLRKAKISELYNLLKNRFKYTKRSDGKEIIKPSGLKVFCLHKSKIKLTKVKTFISHFTEKPIIGIKTEFSEVKLTNDHSLISISDNLICPLKPSDAKFVCSPNKISSGSEAPVINLKKLNLLLQEKSISISQDGNYFSVKNKKKKILVPINIKINQDLMAFFGMWVADGCYMYRKGREGIRLSSYKDPETKKLIKKVLLSFGSSITTTDEGITAVVCNKTLFRIMNYLGFVDGSKAKFVPSWVFGLQKNLIAAFLRGYFSGDGTVSKGDINASTVSNQLKKDLMTLLLFLGIRAKQREDGSGWKISINGKIYKKI